MEEKKTIKKTTVKPTQNSFEDTLEAYGFEKDSFSSCKIVTVLQIPHMKPNEDYPVASLKST